jgi:hypothetical protein
MVVARIDLNCAGVLLVWRINTSCYNCVTLNKGYMMVKAVIGLQVTMHGEPNKGQIEAYTAQLDGMLHGYGFGKLVVTSEISDVLRGGGLVSTLLRIWVVGDAAAVHNASDLLAVAACGSAMFVQLENATERDVQKVVLACARNKIDVDMCWGDTGEAEGIAYPYTASALRVVLGEVA